MICCMMPKVRSIKLLTRDWFPGRYSIRNIWRIENAKRKKKYFWNLLLKGYQFINMVKLDFKFEFLIYIILKWVQPIFIEKSQNDKTPYLENEAFSYNKSIYIWKVLFKSFRMICCMMPKVRSIKSY